MSDQEALSEAARMMAAKRRQISTRCLFCGELIEGTTRRRYCTPSHRAMAAQYRQQGRRTPAELKEGTDLDVSGSREPGSPGRDG